MNGNEEIHDLLLRAVEDVRRPVGASTGELVTRARRQQQRRRVLGSVGALAVVGAAVATLTLAWPRASAGGGEGPTAPSPAASVSQAASTTPTERVRALLPQDAGTVTKVTTFTQSVGGRTVPEPRSALNGRYSLGRSTGVGYLEVFVLDPAHDGMHDPSAAVLRQSFTCDGTAYQGCTDETLADGGTLLTRVVPAHHGTGPGYEAMLITAEGRSVDLIASSGNPAYGALLPAPPFTRDQLSSLVREAGWFSG